MRHTSHFGLGLIAALCLSASYGAALAATSSGIDTPTGQTTLPIAVEGVAGMTLVNQNVATPASGPVYVGIDTTTPLSSLQIGAATELFSPAGGDSTLSNNLYYGGTWKYATSGLGSAIYQDAGAIGFYSAPSGTAGNAATVTNNMEILANGDVGIGTATPATKLDVDGPIRPGSTGVTIGNACSPPGAMAYDLSIGAPVFCSNTSVWTSSAGFTGYQIVTATGSPGAYGSVRASCPSGKSALGGACTLESGCGDLQNTTMTGTTYSCGYNTNGCGVGVGEVQVQVVCANTQ